MPTAAVVEVVRRHALRPLALAPPGVIGLREDDGIVAGTEPVPQAT